MKEEGRRECELCRGVASVHCEADAAFLCWSCDAGVHGVNFLVARHVRTIVCAGCPSTAAGSFSGAGSSPIRALCRSCSPDLPSTNTTATLSSSCISTAESASSAAVADAPPSRWRLVVMAEKVEAEIHRWCEVLGTGSSRRRARVALRLLADYGRELAGVPIRVAMAAALWFVVKREENGAGTALRRLEAHAGVRARAILRAEVRLARAAARGQGLEEGWGECP